jgi:hypothetical protein
VDSVAITGAAFTMVGESFPVTLDPNQTLASQLQSDPTAAGAVTGQLAIITNSLNVSTAMAAPTATGTSVGHESI